MVVSISGGSRSPVAAATAARGHYLVGGTLLEYSIIHHFLSGGEGGVGVGASFTVIPLLSVCHASNERKRNLEQMNI